MTLIVHPSAERDSRRKSMLKDLGNNQLPSSFLYESNAQSRKWLTVHQQCSPHYLTPECGQIYNWLADEAAKSTVGDRISLVGLGCGSGLKDAKIAGALRKAAKDITYWPVDISEDLTREASINSPSETTCPVLLDLANADDSGSFLRKKISRQAALVTLFGLLPNFQLSNIAACLRELISPSDILLCSANLSPGNDYRLGVSKVLPQYDNEPTREWLLGAIAELGIPTKNGQLIFSIEESDYNLLKIVANFMFSSNCNIQFDGVDFKYNQGEKLEVFYSIRHTLDKVHALLKTMGIRVINERMSQTSEEAVFLCQKI